MTGNAAVDVGIVVTLFLALIAFDNKQTKRIDNLTDRVKSTEDCVEGELKAFKDTFTESLNNFKLEVTNRLTAIETAIKKNNKS